MFVVDLKGAKVRAVLVDPSRAALAADYFRVNREHLTATNPFLPEDVYTEPFWAKRLGNSLVDFEEDRSVRLFLMDHDKSDQFIGSISFTQIFRGPFQACYLGYSIARAHEGQGKMHDGLQVAIRYMFDERHVHRIMANYLPDNQRSARVLARLGFVVDGKSDQYLYINGAWREHVLTSLTNTNWTPREEDAELFS